MKSEFLRFLIAGASTFILDFALLFFCTEFLHFHYLLSSALAFTVALVVNYFICVCWVFKYDKKQSFRQIILFAGSSILGLVINQVCMWIFVDLFSIHYMVSKIFSTGIVTLWNYVMKRKAIKLQ